MIGYQDGNVKILVYGAGVLGSLYAAWLRESGQNVSILARGRRLADIREHGIVLEDSASGRQTVTPINAVETFAPEDAYDLVVVLVRKNQITSVLPSLAANKSTPSFLFMINNAAGPDEYISAVGRERVLRGAHAVRDPRRRAGPSSNGHPDYAIWLPALRMASKFASVF